MHAPARASRETEARRRHGGRLPPRRPRGMRRCAPVPRRSRGAQVRRPNRPGCRPAKPSPNPCACMPVARASAGSGRSRAASTIRCRFSISTVSTSIAREPSAVDAPSATNLRSTRRSSKRPKRRISRGKGCGRPAGDAAGPRWADGMQPVQTGCGQDQGISRQNSNGSCQACSCAHGRRQRCRPRPIHSKC